DVQDKMDQMRLIDKAKFMLIEEKHISEDEAHRMIGKVAIYTVGGGTGLQFAYCMDESNPAASMDTHRYVSGYALGLDPDYKIYGLCIEDDAQDDTLRLFTAPNIIDAPVEIDVSISELLAGMGLQTSDELMNPSPVAGDVSGDGEMDVTDVIHMTRYLLGTKKIEDADAFERMDLVNDGVVDIYDLAKLKWMLIHKK
ncbi:MAG: ANTAR domain-containing protein, partial [Oscillospiraceae bacterium]|nr:ANTAR domain-containing protein [Oscillospiraceae bacterium]